MNYWIVKGQPWNTFSSRLVPGKLDTWETARPPKEWKKGDRIFVWESGAGRRVVGLGILENPLLSDRNNVEQTKPRFRVRYLCEPLQPAVGIDGLRKDKVLGSASFLKSGPASTVFPLTPEQGRRLYRLVLEANPSLENLWSDLYPRRSPLLPELGFAEQAVEEGRKHLVTHLRRERNHALVEQKKRITLQREGALRCEVCGFDSQEFYGMKEDPFCEVHHRLPLSASGESRSTTLADLAIVCSNCHRMLHRLPRATIESLRKRVPASKRG